MQFESVFTSIIEVGIATAGFSGIVAVLGGRPQGGWLAGDVGRLTILLQASFSAILFSFLPLTLEGAGLAEPTVWRISSASYAVYLSLSLSIRGRQIRKASDADPSVRLVAFRYAYLGGGILIAVIQGYNVFALHAGWPFVLAVLGELVTAFIMFARLLRGIWEQSQV